MVKELRKRTGIGMGKCKKALEEAKGDIELAISNLRKSGAVSAVQKGGREANEGTIAFAESDHAYALLEVNSETDFVANNERFRSFVKDIAKEIADTKPASLDAFISQSFSGEPSFTIDEYRASMVQALGENIQFRRMLCLEKKPNSSVGIYSHMRGKIVVATEITGSEGLHELAQDIAMHIVAEMPEYLTPEDVPEKVVNSERDIARSQVQGKPEHMVEKIVEGKLRAFYDKVCLLHQKFVRDPQHTIADLLSLKEKEIGKKLSISRFISWRLGESS